MATRRKRTPSPAPPTDAPTIPTCAVRRDGGPLVVRLTVTGLLSAGGLFEVVPVFGATPPTREERWAMTTPASGIDAHAMATDPRHLVGDGIVFQVNLCAHSAQFDDGTLEVTVTQDGEPRPIVPPMRFALPAVAQCQSPAGKLRPTVVTGGFALEVA